MKPRANILLFSAFAGLFFLTTAYSENKDDNATEMSQNSSEKTSPLTGSVYLTSNYMFRGISQTNNEPALQGDLSFKIPHTWIYANLWGSNINFFNTVSYEVETDIGLANTIGNFSWDLSFARYNYQPSYKLSYNEYLASAQWYFLTALIGYSSDVFASGKTGVYYNLGFKQAIPAKWFFNLHDVELSGGIGYYDLPTGVGLRSYADYTLGLTKTVKNFQFTLAWTDTNGHSTDPRRLTNNKIVLTIAYNFS